MKLLVLKVSDLDDLIRRKDAVTRLAIFSQLKTLTFVALALLPNDSDVYRAGLILSGLLTAALWCLFVTQHRQVRVIENDLLAGRVHARSAEVKLLQ